MIDVALEGLDDAAFDVIPHADTSVQRPRENVFPVGRELDARRGRVVLVNEGLEALTTVCVPDANETVQGTGDDEGAVVDDVDAGDGVGVGGE